MKTKIVYSLIINNAYEEHMNIHLVDVSDMLEKFYDVTLEELPNELPLMREIQHVIDLIHGA